MTGVMKASVTIGLIGLGTAANAVAADVPVYSSDEVVVTGTRSAQRLSNALRSTTVITSDDIRASGQEDLITVLQRLGGVEITRNGGAGQPSAVFMRGANSTGTLVLIDGMRVNSATNGTTAFENLPLDVIDHIEIVSGPSSSLYGSDATGGVIQIFTKAGRTTPSYSASVGYGTWNTARANASFNQTANNVDVALSAGFQNSDSFSATKPSIPFDQFNPDRDAYRNINGSAKLAYHFDTDNQVGVTGFYSDGKTHFDDGPTTDDQNHQKLSTISLYSQNQLTAQWQSLLRVGRGTDDSVVSGQFPGTFKTTQDQATWQNTFNVWGGSLVAGAEYLRQHVDSTTAYTVASRTISSAFGGYSGDFGNHGIQLNVRYDDNSQFGAHTTGSIGYGYRFNDAWHVRATAGNAFHAPTFNDLYYPGFSNPDLAPEKSRGWDAGADWNGAGQVLSATYFETRISDAIVLDPGTFLPVNLARARIRGGEFSGHGALFELQWHGKLTLQNPRDDATGAQLPRRARHFGSVGVSRTWNQWTAGAEVVASGPRFDSTDENPDSRMGGYALLNLVASYHFAPAWTAELRWDNVTNKHYELAQNFNTPGSNAFLWLRWSPTQ